MPAFSDYQTVTVQASQITGTLTDFPALFSFTHVDFKSAGNGGRILNIDTAKPADFGFYSNLALTTLLPFEIEFWDQATGEVIAWVNLSSIAVGTVLYIGYHDASQTTALDNGTGTWNSSYKEVHHFGTYPSLSLTDSTSNANNGTNHSATSGGGINNGCIVTTPQGVTSTYAESGVSNCGSSEGAIEWWQHNFQLYNDGLDDDVWGQYDFVNGKLFACQKYLDGNIYIGWYVTGTDKRVIVAASPANWPQYAWVHHVYAWDTGGNSKYYQNGIQIGSTVTSTNSAINNIGVTHGIGTIKQNSTPLNGFSGALDEWRYSNTNKTIDWAVASYNNQVSQATFWGSLSGRLATFIKQPQEVAPDFIFRRTSIVSY